MTTWCRPDRASSTNRRGSCLVVGAANKRQHNNNNNNNTSSYPSDRHQQSSSRHSIADILGWSHGTAIKIEEDGQTGIADRLPSRVAYYRREEGEEEDDEEDDGMASECVDVADMVISDEPLDLSLDKSKCRRERERESSGTPIKRAKVVVDAIEPASDGGTDEGDMDVGPWGSVQPHLQMAANFSTVLQYYLTAARLWQTSEVIRCQDQQRAETDSEANEGGDEGHGSDTTAVVSAVAAVESVLPVQSQQQSNNKRRKKDHMMVAAADLASGDSANGSRPRKTRTTFTGKQLFELERIFEQKKYLSSNERQEVARLLNVTGSQIKIWFQNRRTKWKKQDPNTAAELAQLKSASRSQQQQQQQQQSTSSAPKGKSGSDQAGSTTTSAANAADISAGEEINSDDSSPAGQRSPSPV